MSKGVKRKNFSEYSLSKILEEIIEELYSLKPNITSSFEFDKTFLTNYLRSFLKKVNLYDPVQEFETDKKDEKDYVSEVSISDSEEDEDEESNEDDDEEFELTVSVEEKNNPCYNSYYDPMRVEFKYTYEQESLMAVRKGTCYKCSAYRPILYINNSSNFNTSQICERCVNEMFGDARN